MNIFVCLLLSECVPLHPRSICWRPNSQSDGIRRWGPWEVLRSWGWRFWMGLVLLQRRPESYPYLFLPSDDTMQDVCDPEDSPHPTMPDSDLGLSDSRNVRYTFLLFINDPICGICCSSPSALTLFPYMCSLWWFP